MQVIQPIKILDAIAFSASVAFTAASNVITSAAHGLKQNTIIKVASDDTLPAGLDDSVYYYVVNPTTNTFQVSLEKDGAPVAITDAGTGNHTFTVQGSQEACFVDGFNVDTLELFSDEATNDFTVKLVGSVQEDKPNFNVAQSETNRWDYVQSVELNDGNIIDGSIGIVVSGAIKKILEVNVNRLRWFGLIVSGYTAGDLTAFISLSELSKS